MGAQRASHHTALESRKPARYLPNPFLKVEEGLLPDKLGQTLQRGLSQALQVRTMGLALLCVHDNHTRMNREHAHAVSSKTQ